MDQQRDTTQRILYQILQERPGIEPLIKHASVGVYLDSLPDHAFADDIGRNYPIDTPANAAMSLAYATKTANLEDRVSRRLGDAAEIYGILLPPKQQEKVAYAVPRYLLPKQKKFGIKTASDVPKAEKALLRVSSKLSTEDLATAATVLVKAARDSDLNVDSRVMQWAGLAQCDTEKTANWLEARELACDSNGAYTKLAAVVRHLSSDNTRDDLTKIASTIGKLDAIYDLQKHYGRRLPNPLETVFSTKTAMEKTVSLAGTDVSVKDLMKKGVGFFEDILGKDIAEEISTDGKLDETKLIQELPILPADMLKPILSKMNISPSTEKKAYDLNQYHSQGLNARLQLASQPERYQEEDIDPILSSWKKRNDALSNEMWKGMQASNSMEAREYMQKKQNSKEYAEAVKRINKEFTDSVSEEDLARYLKI